MIKCLHRYGIEIPTSIAHAKRIDLKNGNNFWMNAITKEMTNVGIAFTILDEGKKALLGWTKASGHLVFNVNMDFTQKTRWVKDGHQSPNPTTLAYVIVVSRESFRVGLTYAELMDLDVFCCSLFLFLPQGWVFWKKLQPARSRAIKNELRLTPLNIEGSVSGQCSTGRLEHLTDRPECLWSEYRL